MAPTAVGRNAVGPTIVATRTNARNRVGPHDYMTTTDDGGGSEAEGTVMILKRMITRGGVMILARRADHGRWGVKVTIPKARMDPDRITATSDHDSRRVKEKRMTTIVEALAHVDHARIIPVTTMMNVPIGPARIRAVGPIVQMIKAGPITRMKIGVAPIQDPSGRVRQMGPTRAEVNPPMTKATICCR